MARLITAFLVVACCGSPWAQAVDDEKPLTAIVARQKLNEQVYVELMVRSAKNRLEKRGEIYLDSEEDFHDEKNLAVVINRDGAAEYRRLGIEDPAEHFRGKKLRVRGTVTSVDEVRRIEVSDPKQIELVKEK
jgi:hypothetical protein